MNKKINALISAGALTIALIVTSQACKKKDDNLFKSEAKIPASASVSIQDFDKLSTFFAWSAQVPKEKIKFNAETREFIILNTPLKEKLETVQKEYEKANIYKLNFEQK